MDPVKALLAQLNGRIGDVRGNAERAADAIRSHPEVAIAVFPELYLSGYTYRDIDHLARTIHDAELRIVCDAAAAASTAVIIGFAERIGEGRYGNSAACIDQDGTPIAVYRKTQLFGQEHEVFEPGTELMILDMLGRRVAPLICFDIEFPEPARQLALEGADLLCTASANMDPFYVDHEVGSRARAVENRVPHLYANMVGPGDDMVFVGGSRAVDSWGRVVGTEGSRDTEELIVVDVPNAGGVDDRVDYLRCLPTQLPVVTVARPTAATT
jgi:predicted amidohydrolase